jgi:GNAT superfamily N-acetyltransferase
MVISVERARTPEAIQDTYDVMAELRPHLERESYVARITHLIHHEHYHLAALYEDGVVRGVAGYTLTDVLFSGKIMSIDDLVVTESSRSSGYGRRLLSWLKEEARAQHCVEITLLSHVRRSDAHRFYHREGMTIQAFNFRITL